MKKEVTNKSIMCQPTPNLLVTCRDNKGNNNALAVGFAANVSIDPPMIMIGIVPSRHSYHMIKETGCFVVNLVTKDYEKEYYYLGSHSSANEDKISIMKINMEKGKIVNAPLLSDCPVSIECTVVESTMPGTHELFIGKVECVHCEEKYLNNNGDIDWAKIDLL